MFKGSGRALRCRWKNRLTGRAARSADDSGSPQAVYSRAGFIAAKRRAGAGLRWWGQRRDRLPARQLCAASKRCSPSLPPQCHPRAHPTARAPSRRAPVHGRTRTGSSTGHCRDTVVPLYRSVRFGSRRDERRSALLGSAARGSRNSFRQPVAHHRRDDRSSSSSADRHRRRRCRAARRSARGESGSEGLKSSDRYQRQNGCHLNYRHRPRWWSNQTGRKTAPVSQYLLTHRRDCNRSADGRF